MESQKTGSLLIYGHLVDTISRTFHKLMTAGIDTRQLHPLIAGEVKVALGLRLVEAKAKQWLIHSGSPNIGLSVAAPPTIPKLHSLKV